MKTYFAYSSKEQYQFKAKNIYEARTWIINHLDTSYEWTLGEIINPTIKQQWTHITPD
jgi:hypothetical protein